MLLRNLKCLILVIVFLTIVYPPALAKIIHVPNDSSTIQSSINGASDGDTVLVARGHYYERINFYGKAILVASNFIFDNDTTTIDSTIIDADTLVLGVADTGSVVVFASGEDSNSVIQGFTVKNGIGIHHGSYRLGGGIYCNSTSPTIINCMIIKNNSWNGGGIDCWEASPIIRKNIITENYGVFGGGILCHLSSATINNNLISSNSSGEGGAIFCTQASPYIDNNTINQNSTSSYAGAICCVHESSPLVANNIISNNLEGKGIYCFDRSLPIISHNNFWNNTAGNFAGCPTVVGDTTWGTNINGIPCDSFYNIIRDPLFVDTLNDFHLQENSPCIDAGDNSAAGDSDLDANPRIVDGNSDDSAVVDMGAFEYQPPSKHSRRN